MTQPTDWLEQAKLEIEEEWHEYQKSNPWGVADRARWRREKLIAERARNMEQRKAILDDPANTLFGIPMTAVKRLINEKRAEEGDNWWVLERPHITEQRGVTSAKEFYQEHKEFWVIPVDPDNTDPTLVKVHAFAEAYASSRLAEVERTLECGHPQAGRILSSESALSPLICPACRLAEVTAQLQTLREKFKHYHVAKYVDEKLTDECGSCGFDIRNEIHITREKEAKP